MNSKGLQPRQNNVNCYSYLRPEYSENSASGWTSTLGMAYVDYTGETNLFNESGQPFNFGSTGCNESNSSNTNRGYIKRIQIHLPDGESHELRASDTPLIYNFDTATSDMTGTYYAVDGSHFKYVDDGNGTYRLYMPNGSYYDFASTKTYLREARIRKAVGFHDVNGNQMSFSEPDTSYPNGHWTDTIGRNIAVPLGLAAPTALVHSFIRFRDLGAGRMLSRTNCTGKN